MPLQFFHIANAPSHEENSKKNAFLKAYFQKLFPLAILPNIDAFIDQFTPRPHEELVRAILSDLAGLAENGLSARGTAIVADPDPDPNIAASQRTDDDAGASLAAFVGQILDRGARAAGRFGLRNFVRVFSVSRPSRPLETESGCADLVADFEHDGWLTEAPMFSIQIVRGKGALSQDLKVFARRCHRTLTSEPYRRFVLGLTLAGEEARLWYFDASGCIATNPWGLSENWQTFVSLIVGLCFHPNGMVAMARVGYEPDVRGTTSRLWRLDTSRIAKPDMHAFAIPHDGRQQRFSKHRRIAVQPVFAPYHKLENLPAMYSALADATAALEPLARKGYVLRSVGLAHIVWDADAQRGAIVELDCGDGGGGGGACEAGRVHTGGPEYMMATELLAGKYFYKRCRAAIESDAESGSESEDPSSSLPSRESQDPRSPIKAPQARQWAAPQQGESDAMLLLHPLHNLESLWWLGIWALFRYHPRVTHGIDAGAVATQSLSARLVLGRERAYDRLFTWFEDDDYGGGPGAGLGLGLVGANAGGAAADPGASHRLRCICACCFARSLFVRFDGEFAHVVRHFSHEYAGAVSALGAQRRALLEAFWAVENGEGGEDGGQDGCGRGEAGSAEWSCYEAMALGFGTLSEHARRLGLDDVMDIHDVARILRKERKVMLRSVAAATVEGA